MIPRNILVTGASSGIGRAIASLLFAEGHTVIGTSRNPDRVYNPPAELLALDVTKDSSVADLVEQLRARWNRLDVVVNNAGQATFGPAESFSIAEIQQQLDTNFFGVARLNQSVLPWMREQGAGRLIHISSLASRIPVPLQAWYAASKHALLGYVRSLREEIRLFGIDTVLVEPSFVQTDIAHDTEPESTEIPAWKPILEKSEGLFDHFIRQGMPVERVARVVSRCVASRRPRLRWTVGREAWMLPLLQAVAPAIFRWGLRRRFGLN